MEQDVADKLETKLKAVRTRRAEQRIVLPSPTVRRLAREACGVTQAEVGEVLGYSRQAVVLWEQGRRVEPEGEARRRYLLLLYKMICESLSGELARLEQANAAILDAERK